MAAIAVLPSQGLSTAVPVRGGTKRRSRSSSPDTESSKRPILCTEGPSMNSRSRKARRLQRPPDGPRLAIPPFPHGVQERLTFGSTTADIEDVENHGPASSISPAAFAKAMDGVLNGPRPGLPMIAISPPFTSHNIPPTCLTPSPRSLALGTNDQPDWWFPTGDLVLGVESLMFRVHKQILARHSAVFEDMFALSEPSGDCDNVENVPRVQLHDSASDWMETLAWLYNGRPSYDTQSLQAITFGTIKSHLTISNKYDMPALRHLSQVALEHMYPTNLVPIFCNPPPSNSPQILHASSALLLAIQCDIPSVLPAVVYYVLSSYDRGPVGSSHHLPLDFQKGYSTLQSVATYLCTTLTIPDAMLPPSMLADGPRPFHALLRSEFLCHPLYGYRSCFDIVQGRWLATLARHTVNRTISPSNGSDANIPLLHALRELEERIGTNIEVSGAHPCESCYWAERRLMRRLVGAILAALPWWFGL